MSLPSPQRARLPCCKRWRVRSQAAWPRQSPVPQMMRVLMFPVPLQDTLDATALSPLLGVCPPTPYSTTFPRREKQAAVGGCHAPVLGRRGHRSRERLARQLQTISKRASELPKAPVPPLMFPAARRWVTENQLQVTFPPPKENSRLNAHYCHFSNTGQFRWLRSLLRKALYSGPQHSQAEF